MPAASRTSAHDRAVRAKPGPLAYTAILGYRIFLGDIEPFLFH